MQFFAVLQQMPLPSHQSGQEKEHFRSVDFARQRKNRHDVRGFENLSDTESKVECVFEGREGQFYFYDSPFILNPSSMKVNSNFFDRALSKFTNLCEFTFF